MELPPRLQQYLARRRQELYEGICSSCQHCLNSPGDTRDHYSAFGLLVFSAKSCHLCELLISTLDPKEREAIEERMRSGSYSKVKARISIHEARVEVVTRDRYISGDVTFYGPGCKSH